MRKPTKKQQIIALEAKIKGLESTIVDLRRQASHDEERFRKIRSIVSERISPQIVMGGGGGGSLLGITNVPST